MKNIILLIAICALSSYALAASSQGTVTVTGQVSSSFGMTLGTTAINFGTYVPGGQAPASQNIEIYCTTNTGNDWQIDVTGDAMEGQTTQTVLANSPSFWVSMPIPANPGDFQQAQGTTPYSGGNVGYLPKTNDKIYQSASGETGNGIMISLGINANFPSDAVVDTYDTSLTLTMHE